MGEEVVVGDPASLGLLAMLGGMFWAILIGIWLFVGFLQYKISLKTGPADSAWWSFVPVLNLFQMLKMADKPMWWFLLCLVPFVNIITFAIIWMAISERCGKPSWFGILFLLPFINFVIMLVLAFGDSGNSGYQRVPARPMPRPNSPEQPVRR